MIYKHKNGSREQIVLGSGNFSLQEIRCNDDDDDDEMKQAS